MFKLAQHLKRYRVGILASELRNAVGRAATTINKLEERVISLKPRSRPQGRVLLCYINKAFLLSPDAAIPNNHTNIWESLQIAQTFLNLGYQVDVIDENNNRFVPAVDYSFFVGNRINFERIARLLNPECIKILHIDTSHWLAHGMAGYRRLAALQQRRGIVLLPRRYLTPNLAIEHADYATILGNDSTKSTYQYAGKPLYPVPISTVTCYPWPVGKDFESSRRNFLWFGSGGFVHKGLDLVLEAFAEIPDYHLTVCGPIDKEREFKDAYYKELYKTPNIETVGWVDIESSKFLEISRRCLALIYPSCAEGQCGGVVTCMHAGLIPIVSYQSGVEVDGFGITLETCSIDAIKDSVKRVACLSIEELESRSRKAWEYARANHTRERFAEAYRSAILQIIDDRQVREVAARQTIPDTVPAEA